MLRPSLLVGTCFLLSSCCSVEYTDRPTNRDHFLTAGSTLIYEDQSGNQSTLHCNQYICEWGSYFETYPECTQARYEHCHQAITLLSGEEALAHVIKISEGFISISLGDIHLQLYNIPDGNESIGDTIINGFAYSGVYKVKLEDSIQNDISNILFNGSEFLLSLEMDDGTIWEKVPD